MASSAVSESMKSRAARAPLESDRLLQALALVPEKTSIELGITLNLDGLLVTGFVISQEAYFEQLTQGIRETKADDEMKSLLEDFLTELKEPIIKSTAEKATFPRFIHLRDAKLYPSEGKGMPSLGSTLWRGDIDSVSGFCLGEMYSSPKQITA
ncbi:gas vesicle accessory protein GvpU [Leptolyngbya iicbica]|uniref:Gas vesicle protein n=2 Tax=Cyanophyceae TaxID=3028117 RepID=A0A4Q7E8K6_9CYAN|nr:gas vesicle accessory protein GvpU [Leptolyngbya sp. LK]RZM78704.1 hypothetical protein DYY88_07840 [Leptolyngbya sp. LK]